MMLGNISVVCLFSPIFEEDKMKQGLVQCCPCYPTSLSSLSLTSSSPSSLPFCPKFRHSTLISATLNSSIEDEEHQKLPARERRKLRNERREKNAVNWREEVEMRLIDEKPKKTYPSWKDELNLNNLARLGPQWWIVRITRVSYESLAERLAGSLAKKYPDMEFKMYNPTVQEKRKLKNGSFSVKSKPLFPGCIYLRCVLNKEIHDFILACYGVRGFIGFKVGNTIRQINKPSPVSEDDMEAIFRQAEKEQEKADRAFQDEQKAAPDIETSNLNSQTSDLETQNEAKPKKGARKPSEPAAKGRTHKLPKTGSPVKVVSGAFAEFSGILKKLDRKNRTATVGFTLLGKETIADVDINDIVELVE